MLRPTVRLHDAQQIQPDLDRVIGRLFIPGSVTPGVDRAANLARRVLSLDEAAVSRLLADVLSGFRDHHPDLAGLLRANAAVVAPPDVTLTEDQTLLLGAAFTMEYAIEGAALCNPSVVPHPDQSDLEEGELRLAVSLRGIGEGHISALEFTTATVTDSDWYFGPREDAPLGGLVSQTSIPRALLAALVAADAEPHESAFAVLDRLPGQVRPADVDRVLADLPDQNDAGRPVSALRRHAASGYTVTFPDDVSLDRRVLLPSAPDESHGVEDARFTLFTDDDGTTSYRACYTAYDGVNIGNRILISPDLRTFTSHPVTGPGARNKGMALFPRRIGGRFAALSRADGMTIGFTQSDDSFVWDTPVDIEGPQEPWQILQTGNGGTPLETERGWLVITHGVGFLRTYSLGAILLDLDDPTRVIGRLQEPLLSPTTHAGYVPSVVFTCGATIHRGRLFVPHGVGDVTIAVASFDLDELLDNLTSDSAELMDAGSLA